MQRHRHFTRVLMVMAFALALAARPNGSSIADRA